MGLVIWRFAKILTVVAVLAGSAYYSLRTRVEAEIGPWEKWVGKDPTKSEVNTQKPKNLKGRFWTGVPRGGGGDVGRIDRHGYSLGYSLSRGGAEWAAVFLPGDKVASDTKPGRGIWIDDPEITRKEGGGRAGGGTGGQIVPGWLMDSFYGLDDDTWYRSNIVDYGEKTMKDWSTHLGEIADYAAVYGGVVVFLGPYRGGEGQGFFTVVLRRGERGPEVIAFMLDEKAGGGLGKRMVAVDKVEAATNLRFFADLPPEWRNYLRRKKPGASWVR